MTVTDQLNSSIDRIQDICLVDYPMDGPEQRSELWFVLCDLLAPLPGRRCRNRLSWCRLIRYRLSTFVIISSDTGSGSCCCQRRSRHDAR